MLDRELNLCDDCGNVNSFPDCLPIFTSNEIIFGEGVGKDNIIYCKNYSNMVNRLLHHPNCTPVKCDVDCRLAAKAEQNLPELNDE